MGKLVNEVTEANGVRNNEPDAGAGARQLIEELTARLGRDDATSVVVRSKAGELLDPAEPRIKQCVYCSFCYRDKTRPNNSKACSPECKAEYDAARKRQKRADKALLNPRLTNRDKYYASGLEYSFWSDEKAMINHHANYGKAQSPEKIDAITHAQQRDQLIGGRRRQTSDVKADDFGVSHKVSVKMVKDAEAREASEVTTFTIDPEEYYAKRYSEEHLRMARFRAQYRD